MGSATVHLRPQVLCEQTALLIHGGHVSRGFDSIKFSTWFDQCFCCTWYEETINWALTYQLVFNFDSRKLSTWGLFISKKFSQNFSDSLSHQSLDTCMKH